MAFVGARKRVYHAGHLLVFPFAIACIITGCHDESLPTIQLMTGATSEQQLSFSPKSSLAEYVELPAGGDQLRVILANYELTCEGYAPTPDTGVLVVLTFLLPVGQRPAVGTYPWPGLPHADKPAENNLELKSPVVMPVIRIGKTGFQMLPGGSVDIQRLNLERQGEVVGVMRLEQSGGDGHPPTRLFGSFKARVCRTTVSSGT